MVIKQLTPDEYDEDRKKAMEEVYGLPWAEVRIILLREQEKAIKKESKIDKIRETFNKGLTAEEAYNKFKGQIDLSYIKIAYADLKSGRVSK